MKQDLELLLAVASASHLSPAEASKLGKQLNSALLVFLKAAPLDQMRRLNPQTKAQVAGRLKVAFKRSELKALSAKWEPQRTIEEGETQTDIAKHLNSLMFGERERYVPVASSETLKKARAASEAAQSEMIEKIKHWAPTSHLKRLAKKWDAHWPRLSKANRDEFAEHLTALLSGKTEPFPKPLKSKAA